MKLKISNRGELENSQMCGNLKITKGLKQRVKGKNQNGN